MKSEQTLLLEVVVVPVVLVIHNMTKPQLQMVLVDLDNHLLVSPHLQFQQLASHHHNKVHSQVLLVLLDFLVEVVVDQVKVFRATVRVVLEVVDRVVQLSLMLMVMVFMELVVVEDRIIVLERWWRGLQVLSFSVIRHNL